MRCRGSVPPRSTLPSTTSSRDSSRTDIMMNLSRKAAVVGVYEHPTRFAPDKTVYQIMAESLKGALDDAGLTIKDVDGVCTAGMGGLGIIGLCDYLNLTPNYVD